MTGLNIGAELVQARDEMEAACARIADVQRAVRDIPLPAPALTEDAIVAALKADPAMAGRVIARLAVALTPIERDRLRGSASNEAMHYAGAANHLVTMLAVALAAASYRG